MKFTAQDYTRIHGTDENWDQHADGPLVRAADSASWQAYLRLAEQAREHGVHIPLLRLPVSSNALHEQIAHLTAQLRADIP